MDRDRENAANPLGPRVGGHVEFEQVYRIIFYKAAVFYNRRVPKSAQRWFEYALLFTAVLLFGVATYLHWTFAKEPFTCLEKIGPSTFNESILRVLVVDVDVNESWFHFDKISLHRTVSLVARYTQINSTVLPGDCLCVGRSHTTQLFASHILRMSFDNSLVVNQSCVSSLFEDNYHMESVSVLGWVDFSNEYGLLSISDNAARKLGVPITVVILDTRNNTCFGNGLQRAVMKYLRGYEELLISSLRLVISREKTSGFIHNLLTNNFYRFTESSAVGFSMISAILMMFGVTFTVTVLLRYCHQTVFYFIMHSLEMFEMRMPISVPIAPFLSLILSLAGIEHVMLDFFENASMSFLAILLVWQADHYYTICCHTAITRKHWPRFFYLYLLFFFLYHYLNRGQFSGIFICSIGLFVQHSMFYFFHRFELPAVMESLEQSTDLHDVVMAT